MKKDQAKGNFKEANGKAKRTTGKNRDDDSQEFGSNSRFEQNMGKSQVRPRGSRRDSDKSSNINAQSSGRS